MKCNIPHARSYMYAKVWRCSYSETLELLETNFLNYRAYISYAVP